MPKPRASVLTAVLLLTVGYSPSVFAALDMFLDLGADVPGESTDTVHTNQADVLAWSWGMFNPGTTHLGGSTNVSKANFQDLSLTKYVDTASPKLLLRCANGAHIPKATLFVRTTGTNPVEYIKVTLTEVLLSSVSTGGSGGEDRLTENVSLNFARVQLDYTSTAPPGPEDSFGWDIPGNFETIPRPVGDLISTLFYTNGAPVARLTWISTAGANYQVWAATNVNAAFQKYGSPTPSAGTGITSVTVPADALRKFFRIETLPVQ
jgi:type VI secretion system secreted protein Hcp